jgi:hypothetical protein
LAWIDNGPISLPTPSLTRLVSGVIIVVALAGAGVGFRGAWRGDRPSFDVSDSQGVDQTTLAKPIVEIQAAQQQAAASNTVAANSAVANADQTDDSNAIAARTEAVEEAQSKAAGPPANVDELLTSQSEKPQAPAKGSDDEGAPGAPDKGANDVPF